MNLKNLRILREKKGITQIKLSTELGISQELVSQYELGKSIPTIGNLLKIADYFNVSMDYLLGREQFLTQKDNRDIAKDLDNIMEKLTAGEDGPASYNGEELSPDAAELFRDELEIALKRLKIINKEKYTPKKYKK